VPLTGRAGSNPASDTQLPAETRRLLKGRGRDGSVFPQISPHNRAAAAVTDVPTIGLTEELLLRS
jgi:hypothetical protein